LQPLSLSYSVGHGDEQHQSNLGHTQSSYTDAKLAGKTGVQYVSTIGIMRLIA